MASTARGSRLPAVTGIAFAIWVLSTIYNLIGFAVAIDAIDEGTERPSWTALAGAPAIAISIAAFVAFLLGVTVMTAKRHRSAGNGSQLANV